MSIQQHARDALEFWEQGHAILVHVANALLDHLGIDQTIEDPQRPATDQSLFGEFQSAWDGFIKHYGKIDHTADHFPPAERVEPWYFGRFSFCARENGAKHIRDEVTRHCDKTRSYGADWWLREFVEPMRKNASKWREWLLQVSTTARRPGGRNSKWDHVVGWVDDYKYRHASATDNDALSAYKRKFPKRTAPTLRQLRDARSYRRRAKASESENASRGSKKGTK